ncbi:3-demethylubiquinone-9 3-methyltransferase and 2-octaprenyl-6-hydroxy phenol methylase [Burkholderiales bacterium]|jgi:2-polyprenyl-6-hydroxyphenyl methylase/3-demethylubiquinone-9 3-methyltransferase|nr:3-demethylubiquinone-9 3-methyltransferase and 2-octaprenyl-6-hydroxy phenol methylase [Burkholderiales bacterium]
MNDPNVDPVELKKFSDLAHRWWDPNGAFRPLHQLNPVRMDWIERHVPLAGCCVLDVGCGGGILSEAMSARGAKVLGIDLAGKSLQVARLHALESGAEVEYRAISAEELAQEQPAQFDLVTCMEMLEHVPDPARTIESCARLVRPGGTVLFSTINRNPKSFLLAVVGAEYVLGLLPRGTHDYARFLRPSELARGARASGLEVGDLTGMRYNPLTQRFSLHRDTDVNYLVACRRPS